MYWFSFRPVNRSHIWCKYNTISTHCIRYHSQQKRADIDSVEKRLRGQAEPLEKSAGRGKITGEQATAYKLCGEDAGTTTNAAGH